VFEGIGAAFRALGWKTLIFFERAVPISPNASYHYKCAALQAVAGFLEELAGLDEGLLSFCLPHFRLYGESI
jgi:hypothetical protein